MIRDPMTRVFMTLAFYGALFSISMAILTSALYMMTDDIMCYWWAICFALCTAFLGAYMIFTKLLEYFDE